jgi:hypothetical protein
MKHKDPREIEYARVAHHPKSANRPNNTGVVLFLSERFPPVAAAKTELLINMAFRFGDPCETANLLLIYESDLTLAIFHFSFEDFDVESMPSL